MLGKYSTSVSLSFLIQKAPIYFIELAQRLNKIVYVRGCKLKCLWGANQVSGVWPTGKHSPFLKRTSPTLF